MLFPDQSESALCLQHFHDKGDTMKQPTPHQPLARPVLAVAVLTLGALGLYGGYIIDGAFPAQAAVASAATAPQSATAWGNNPLQRMQAFMDTTAYSGPAVPAAGPHEPAQPAPVPIGAAAKANLELPADFIPANADGSTDNAPFARIRLAEVSSGAKAIALLGEHLEAVAQWYGMNAEEMRQLLLSDSSVHLDRKGRMLHIEGGPATTATSIG